MKTIKNDKLLLAKMIDAEIDAAAIPDMDFVRVCTSKIETEHPAPTKDELEAKLDDILKKRKQQGNVWIDESRVSK